AGQDDPEAVIDSTDVFAQTLFVIYRTGLGGAERTVRVSVDRATEIGFVSNVEGNGRTLAATVTATTPTDAAIDATITGLTSTLAKRLTVTATAFPSSGPVTVPLAMGAGTGTTFHWTGTVAIDAGGYTPIQIDVTGAFTRMLLT